MANDLKGRPWIIDTFSAVTPVKKGNVFTTGFVFRDYTGGAASVATVTDTRRNRIIVKLLGNAAQTPVGEAWFANQPLDDIAINADSGVVEVIVV